MSSTSESAGSGGEQSPSEEDSVTTQIHQLKFDSDPQQTVIESYLHQLQGATVRFDLENDVAPGDVITFARTDGVKFGTGKISGVVNTVVRNAYPQIVSKNAKYGLHSTRGVWKTLNDYYPETILLTTPVTIIYYRVLEVDLDKCDLVAGVQDELDSKITNATLNTVSDGGVQPLSEPPEQKTAGDNTPTEESTENHSQREATNPDVDLPAETVICAYADPNHTIQDRWFFARVDGVVKRFHPINDYSPDTNNIEYRVNTAIDAENIVVAPVKRSVLNAYQRGEEPIPDRLAEKRRF